MTGRWIAALLGLAQAVPALAMDLAGHLDWEARVELGTLGSGTIEEVHVVPGQRVEKGELLVQLDPRRFRARLQEAQAALEQARQHREEARRELERAVELYDRTVLADHDLKLAEIGAAEAQAAQMRAQAALTSARLDVEYSEVRAPFAGVVVAVWVAAGQAVVNRLQVQPLVVLADDSRWRVKAMLDAERAGLIEKGQAVQVGAGGQWFPGEVRGIGLEPAAEGGPGVEYELRVVFTAPAGSRMRAGQQATVRIDD